MSRSLPDDAYIGNGFCQQCGAPLVDLMGDDVCLACDVEPDEEGVLTWRESRVGANNEENAAP